jgi:Lysylphosphatidylglycerol synthase TM region
MNRRVFRYYLRLRRLHSRVISSPWINRGFQVAVLLLLLAILWYELGSRDRLSDMWSEFNRHLSGANWLIVLAVLLLMPLNWLAETEKWYQFVRHYEPMPRYRAVMAVLSGVSLSLFTPNRVGEYGGRMLFVQPHNQWKAIIANLIGNFCQFIVLLGFGIIGAAYTLRQVDIVDPQLGWWLVAAATLALVAMMGVYFNLEGVLNILRRLPGVSRFRWIGKRLRLDILRSFNQSERFDILRWAVIRYIVYAAQYYLLLRFFSIEVGLLDGFAGIAGLFLLQTSIPLPPMTGLVARGNLAVVLWTQYGANDLSALAATFSLWVINLILPALIGTFCLLHVNIRKSLGYAEDSSMDPALDDRPDGAPHPRASAKNL